MELTPTGFVHTVYNVCPTFVESLLFQNREYVRQMDPFVLLALHVLGDHQTSVSSLWEKGRFVELTLIGSVNLV